MTSGCSRSSAGEAGACGCELPTVPPAPTCSLRGGVACDCGAEAEPQTDFLWLSSGHWKILPPRGFWFGNSLFTFGKTFHQRRWLQSLRLAVFALHVQIQCCTWILGVFFSFSVPFKNFFSKYGLSFKQFWFLLCPVALMHVCETLKKKKTTAATTKTNPQTPISTTDLGYAPFVGAKIIHVPEVFFLLSPFSSLFAAIMNSFVTWGFNFLFIQEHSVLGRGGGWEDFLVPAWSHSPRFMQIPSLRAERVAPPFHCWRMPLHLSWSCGTSTWSGHCPPWQNRRSSVLLTRVAGREPERSNKKNKINK